MASLLDGVWQRGHREEFVGQPGGARESGGSAFIDAIARCPPASLVMYIYSTQHSSVPTQKPLTCLLHARIQIFCGGVD